MLQNRKGQAIAKQFSVECVVEIFDADEVSDSSESCDLNFASCVNNENLSYIRDELTSDKMVLEYITLGSIIVELEEVDVTSKCAILSPWSASGFSNYRAISATPVGGGALHEIAVSSAKEMDMLMTVATFPTIENVWEEVQSVPICSTLEFHSTNCFPIPAEVC